MEDKINTESDNPIYIFPNNKANSIIKIGNLRLYTSNKFNWFQIKMFKFLLGLEVEKNQGGFQNDRYN